MFQVDKREKGQCILNCPGDDVVSVTKPGEPPVKVCKRHLWDMLGTAEKKSGKKQPKGEQTQ